MLSNQADQAPQDVVPEHAQAAKQGGVFAEAEALLEAAQQEAFQLVGSLSALAERQRTSREEAVGQRSPATDRGERDFDGFTIEGDAFVRLAGVIAHVRRAFDTAEQAEIWLWSPNPALKGAVPIVEARTEKGAWNVHAVLGRFEHGVYG